MGFGWHESGNGRGEVRRVLCRRSRLSGPVGALLLLAAPGCFLVDPPEYVPPEKERPNLHVLDAQPPAYQVVVVESGTTLRLRVPVVLAPSTQPYTWQVWRNFDLEGEEILFSTSIRADVSEISYDWQTKKGFATGCQQITILVANSGSLGTGVGVDLPPDIRDRSDVATVSWWLSVDPLPGEELTLVDCPGPKDPFE